MDLVVRPAAPDDPCRRRCSTSRRSRTTTPTRAARRARWRCCDARVRADRARRELRGLPRRRGRRRARRRASPASRSREGDRLARRFVALTLRAAAAVALARACSRHLRAAGRVSPQPAARTPATSTRSRSTPRWRRRGVARALLDEAERAGARAPACDGVALDTGLHNRPPARSTRRYGFGEREIRRAPDDADRPRARRPRLRRLPQAA